MTAEITVDPEQYNKVTAVNFITNGVPTNDPKAVAEVQPVAVPAAPVRSNGFHSDGSSVSGNGVCRLVPQTEYVDVPQAVQSVPSGVSPPVVTANLPVRVTNGANCGAGFCAANGGTGCPNCPNSVNGVCACGSSTSMVQANLPMMTTTTTMTASTAVVGSGPVRSFFARKPFRTFFGRFFRLGSSGGCAACGQ